MKWPKQNLSLIAKVIMGQSPPGKTYNEDGNGLPFFQGKAEFGVIYPAIKKWCSAPLRIAMEGDILLSVRAPVGPTNIAPCKSCIGRGLSAIRAKSEAAEQKYLWFFFKYLEPILSKRGQGSTFAAIKRSEINEIKVPFPSLSEQRRIVEILDQAEALQKKRSDADEKATRILPAIFYNMFGDPATNPMGWDTVPLDKIVDIGTQLVDPNQPDFLDLPHIGGEQIEKDTGRILSPILVRNSNLRSNKFYFSSDHILYSKIRPYLNKVAYPRFSGVCSADIYPLRPKNISVTHLYLLSLLRTQAFLDYAKMHSDRLRIPKLNKTQLGAFEFPLPGSHLLIDFDARARKIVSIENSRFVRQEKIEKLYQTILYRAFSGDLTASWRKAHMKELLQEMERQSSYLEKMK